MEYDVDIYKFISLVESKPIIWDMTLDDFKQKAVTHAAWRDIAVLLKKDYQNWDIGEQEVFRTYITKKWKNIKDCWVKSNKKRQEMGRKYTKKYVYEDNLQFLKKCKNFSRGPPKNSEYPQFINDKVRHANVIQPSTSSATQVSSPQPVSMKRKIPEENESRPLTLKESEERHVSFIKGILPSLHKFTETQVLQFQMGVLELIQNIQINGYNTKTIDPLGEPQIVYENVTDFPSFPSYSQNSEISSKVKIKKQDLSSSCSSFSDDSVTLD